MLFRWPSRSALPIGKLCSDDLVAAHYRLVHSVLMVGIWPTTEPIHIFYWDYNQMSHKGHISGQQCKWLHMHRNCQGSPKCEFTCAWQGRTSERNPFHTQHKHIACFLHAVLCCQCGCEKTPSTTCVCFFVIFGLRLSSQHVCSRQQLRIFPGSVAQDSSTNPWRNPSRLIRGEIL